MTGSFKTIDVTDVVWIGPSGFSIGGKALDALLEPLCDRLVKLVLHMAPPEPLDDSLPGAGSCMWRGSEDCPAGHAKNPLALTLFQADGCLKGPPWMVDGAGGCRTLPFSVLHGHRARLAVVTTDHCLEADPVVQALTARLQELTTAFTAAGTVQS